VGLYLKKDRFMIKIKKIVKFTTEIVDLKVYKKGEAPKMLH